MSLFNAADMRPDSLAEFVHGCELTDAEVGDDTKITSAIARLTTRLQDWTSDVFESFSDTVDVDSDGGRLLMLPYRTTAISSVTFRLSDGTYSPAQTATAYHLSSSLNAAGDAAVTDQDYLEAVPYSAGFSWTDIIPTDLYRWPVGPRIVRVVGTFGWTTPPGDAKRAVAMLVYDHFKPIRADLGRASDYSSGSESVHLSPIDADHPSGIPRVDEIVTMLKRHVSVAVG